MPTPLHGWTEPTRTAGQRADPSGVQDSATALQAWLLPGMATVTPNVRYISLFTALRRIRQEAGEQTAGALPLRDYWRRVEALIAAASVLHHQDGDIPGGIVGRGFADRTAGLEIIELRTGLVNPPYNIYRGTLGNLGLLDLSQDSDPLFERARPLAEAWSPSPSGGLTDDISQGLLQLTVPRAVVQNQSADFCICQVPDGSREQKAMIDLLFGFQQRPSPPSFDPRDPGLAGMRVTSWRLLLEIVDRSTDIQLDAEYMMARLLQPDVLGWHLQGPLRQCLLLWRWIAARAFFERGWTFTFNRTLARLKDATQGYTRDELSGLVRQNYIDKHPNEGIVGMVEDAAFNDESTPPLIEMFSNPTRRDSLRLIIAGISAAKRDRDLTALPLLSSLFDEGSVPFAAEESRLNNLMAAGASASDLYAEISARTLVEHVQSALRRMSQGGPDSLHVDFETDRWLVPSKAISWDPRPAEATSRLDIALGWAMQLGLVESDDGVYRLTPLGLSVRDRWDEEYASWE